MAKYIFQRILCAVTLSNVFLLNRHDVGTSEKKYSKEDGVTPASVTRISILTLDWLFVGVARTRHKITAITYDTRVRQLDGCKNVYRVALSPLSVTAIITILIGI